MSTSGTRRSLFATPGCGTLFLFLPAATLIGLALFFAGFRPRHAFGLLLLLYGAPLMVIGILAFLLLVLSFITLARSMRLTEPPPPSRWWAVPPLVFGVGLLGFIGFVLVLGHRPIQDVADANRLSSLKSAALTVEASAEPDGSWAQWRGPRRDALSRELNLLLDWGSKPPKVLWKKPIKGGFSSVAVANGKLYATDRDGKNERVLCFDAETGDELWTYSYLNDYGGLEFGAGPRATPTVHDGKVYTVGATGTMLCLEAEPAGGQPKLLWRHDLMDEFDTETPRWGVSCSPLIEGDLVIVMPGGPNGSVAAFDRHTGKLAWKALDDVGGYSSPMAGNPGGVRQIVCLTGEGLAGLDPKDGTKLWYYPWVTTFEGNIATPIIAGNYVFISSSYNKGCALLEIVNEGGKLRAEPVYVKANKLMRNHHSTCVLHDGHLYGFDVNTNNNSAVLKCIDFRTAEERWADRSITKGTLLFADGHLIIQTEDGKLVIVEAAPQAFRKKGEFKAFDSSQTWALPALAKGRLYIRDGHALQCLDLRSESK